MGYKYNPNDESEISDFKIGKLSSLGKLEQAPFDGWDIRVMEYHLGLDSTNLCYDEDDHEFTSADIFKMMVERGADFFSTEFVLSDVARRSPTPIFHDIPSLDGMTSSNIWGSLWEEIVLMHEEAFMREQVLERDGASLEY